MINIRLFFQKTDRAKYISHLDLNRAMQRALARSRLPVWYTQGFNPHLYITFALPLALGYSSDCESMDLRLNEEIPFDEVKTRLNAVLPMGLRVAKVAEPVHKPEVIANALYRVVLTFDQGSISDVRAKFDQFCAQQEILTEKKGKKGIRTIDIKPLVKALETDVQGNQLCLVLRCAAGAQLNINPTLFLDAFLKAAGLACDDQKIHRCSVLEADGADFC